MPRATAKSDADKLRGMEKAFGSNFERLPPDDQALLQSVQAATQAKWAAVAEKKARKAEIKAGKKRAKEDYESGDGFVANASNDEGTRSKKNKTKSGRLKGGSKNENSEEMWEISGKRRVTVDTFNEKLMVNIREYYEKEGEMLPGKKGISLPIPQFNELVRILPELETVLTTRGETFERPKFDGDPAAATGAEEREIPVGQSKDGKKKKKANIEATSEEEENAEDENEEE